MFFPATNVAGTEFILFHTGIYWVFVGDTFGTLPHVVFANYIIHVMNVELKMFIDTENVMFICSES
jgi:hypothetical protein